MPTPKKKSKSPSKKAAVPPLGRKPLSDLDAYRCYLLGRSGMVLSAACSEDSELALAATALGTSDFQRAEPTRHRGDAVFAADCLLMGKNVPGSARDLLDRTEELDQAISELEKKAAPDPRNNELWGYGFPEPNPVEREFSVKQTGIVDSPKKEVTGLTDEREYAEKADQKEVTALSDEQLKKTVAETIKEVKKQLAEADKLLGAETQPSGEELLKAGKKAAAELGKPGNELGSEAVGKPTGFELIQGRPDLNPLKDSGKPWEFPAKPIVPTQEQLRGEAPLKHDMSKAPKDCPACQETERLNQQSAGRSPRAG